MSKKYIFLDIDGVLNNSETTERGPYDNAGIQKALFTPASSLMVINGEYYQPMATKKYSLNSPALSMDKYRLMCDEQKR